MAESERTRARERRAGGRQQRRTEAAEPLEQPGGAADGQSGGSRSQPLAAARTAAGTAAAAALAGALAGGAKALAERRRRGRNQTPAPPDETPSEEPTPERSDSETEDEASQEPQAEVADDEDEQEADEPREPERGASSSEVSKMLERARSHVRDLLGEPPESVSGIERSNGSWSVTLEVVEVHRVPETTDVLASYVVVLDGDGDLVSLERKRRYFRSQVEEGS